VTGSAGTSGTSGHGEEAHRIGKGARSMRGSAAWQQYLKENHARLVLGAPRSPGLIFLLCEQQPLELRCFWCCTVAMVTARTRAPAMARVGGPAAGRGARRRGDLLRRSAARGSKASKRQAINETPLKRSVLRHANGRDEGNFASFV